MNLIGGIEVFLIKKMFNEPCGNPVQYVPFSSSLLLFRRQISTVLRKLVDGRESGITWAWSLSLPPRQMRGKGKFT